MAFFKRAVRSITPPPQSSNAPSMALEPVVYEGRSSGMHRSGGTDAYHVRASPPGSYQDYDTGPSLERLVMAVAEVKSAVNHFAQTLILDMYKYPEELKQLKQRIRHEVQEDVDTANHWKFLVQAFVCQRMFEGFEAENGFFGMEHFDGQKMSTFMSFADFTKYKDKAATISELFARDSEDRSFLGRYCFKKFKAICVDPVTNHSLGIYEQEWSWVVVERHPQSEFYQSFLKVAVSVWLLHRLVHSFEQGWSMLGWETFPKGNKFSMQNMESVADGNEKTDVNLVVGFLVIPGFQVSKSVVKCEVYLRNKNNLTDMKLMDGSEARLREFRASSCLKDAVDSAETVQKMFDLLKFNNEQCKYLFDKLYVVVQSANLFLKLSGSIPVGTTSSNVSTDFVKIFELLMVLGKQIESFVEGCCRDDWIQAAMVRANVSEYVSSLGFNLDLCKVALGEDRAASGCLTLDAVDSMNKSEVELVKTKASVDARLLVEKVILTLNSLHGEDRYLATYLLQRLLKINPSISFENGTLCSNLFARVKSGDQVGRGASATIYKAMWLGTRVAKKTFGGSENVEFEKEVQILSRLCHPNITSMFCCAKNERNCSIIMELMDGDLRRLVDERCEVGRGFPPFPILEAVDIMLQIGEGVNYLHNQGIVHRDLKSKNILYMNVKVKNAEIGYVQVKVADFGISKARDTNTTYSELTCNTGTNRWMPPEIIRLRDGNEGGLPSNADLLPKYPFKLDSYSFGLVCYEILVGREPFSEYKSPIEVKRRVLDRQRPILPCKSAECPVTLKALIEKCWNHEPNARPTFAEICRELKYIKYSLLAGTHAVDDSKGQVFNKSLEHVSSGKTWANNLTPPPKSCMNNLTDGKIMEGRVESLEKSFSDKTLANYSTPANYQTPPPKSSIDRILDSRGGLRSSSNYSGYTSGGAENVDTSSNYSSHTQTPAAAPRAPTDRDLQAALHVSSTGFQQSCHGHYDLSHYYLKGKQMGESPSCADYVGPVIVTDVGRGRGRRLILTKGVEAGELLLVSNPIAFLALQDVDQTRNDISQAFVNGKIQDEFRKIIEDLHPQDKVLEKLSTLCDGKKVLLAPLVNQTDSECATVEVLDAARIRRVIQLNAINGDATMGWKNLPGSGEQDKKVEHWGLWWLPSFINHSCLPSSSPILVGKALFVFASRDLRAGDEVTRPYFDIFQPLDQRKELSTKGWGFVCYCPRCKLEDALHTSLSKVTEQYVKLMELASKSKSEFGTDEKLSETQTAAALKFFHKLESKLKDFKLNGSGNNWVRSSFLHYIDMISGDHELHTHLESIVEALVTVCPGSETTLHMAVVAKDSARRTFGKKSTKFKAGNQRALNICRFTYGKQKGSVLQSIVDKNDYQS